MVGAVTLTAAVFASLAAAFQNDPQALMSHPGVNSAANTKWGLDDSQARPYPFDIRPFMADKNLMQQGDLSFEPFAVAKAGVKPNVFLMADHGYPPYSTTMRGHGENRG